MKAARRLSTATLPPSPLSSYLSATASSSSLRTGFTHNFALSSNIDRSAAAAFRQRCRDGSFSGQTSGVAPGFVQANFVALPLANAFDFLTFCLRNPRACPLLDVTTPNHPYPLTVAPSADLRTDLPKYRLWSYGDVMSEVDQVSDVWTSSMVGFLLGCSFSWEQALHEAGHTPRQIEMGCNCAMYKTNIRNATAGPFGGSLVVSMRPYKASQLKEVEAITGRYPGAHGAPIHWGDPSALGVSEEQVRDGMPDFGDKVEVRDDEYPVFWACGVTPQAALIEAKLPFAVTHSPGHMLVTDLRDEELKEPITKRDVYGGPDWPSQ